MTEQEQQLLFTTTLRDSIHNLDLSLLDNQKIFSKHVRSFISLHEGVRFEAYTDTKGNVTIGIGFNMDSGGKKNGRIEWDEAFENNIANNKGKIDFDEAYDGKLSLTQEQVDKLFDHSVNIRVKELAERIYKESWSKLRANEKITIISAYFNCPGLVIKDTNFYANITKYAKTSDKKYLLNTATEIRDKSNPGKSKGLQNRRNCEAAMLDSTKVPFYTNPNAALMPKTVMKIIAGKTVVPIDIGRYSPKNTSSDYFIWRTQLDDKVRPAHLQNEGKVFKKKDYHDNNGNFKDKAYNCRCFTEEVTNNLYIIPDSNLKKLDYTDKKFIDRFIRFGGGRMVRLG